MHISKICVPPRGSSPCFLLPPVQGAPLCNSGVRNLRGLKLPSDQQWQWIRNKVHSKCKELESSPNHLSPPPPPHPTPWSTEKVSSRKSLPGAKKVGDAGVINIEPFNFLPLDRVLFGNVSLHFPQPSLSL